MSFRQRQKYCSGFFTAVFEIEQKNLENGCIVHQSVNQSEKVLPDPKLFDLGNQLDAGINLEEVNSKVLSSKSVDASKVVSFFKSKTVTPNKDSNNEN